MEKLRAYWRSAVAYYHTPKGHHDILDYGRAVLIILLVMAAALLLAHYLFAR